MKKSTIAKLAVVLFAYPHLTTCSVPAVKAAPVQHVVTHSTHVK